MLAALELVNRDLLENQRAWFRTRANEHRRSSDWTTSWGGLATALAFVGGSGAVIASFVPSQTWLAVSGVIGAAVGAYAVNREACGSIARMPGATRKRPPRSTPSPCATTRSRPRSGRQAGSAARVHRRDHRTALGRAQALARRQRAGEAVLGKLDGQLRQLNGKAKPAAAGGNGAAGPAATGPEPGPTG